VKVFVFDSEYPIDKRFFTINKIYDVTQITPMGNFCVIDEAGNRNALFKEQAIELEEYKIKLVKQRFEQ